MNSFDIARFDEMVERTVLLKQRVADQEVTIELLRIMVETLRERVYTVSSFHQNAPEEARQNCRKGYHNRGDTS
jgi:hypothetical protein